MANEEQLSMVCDVDLWGEWRAEHRETVIDLRGADLSGANLADSNLSRADLADANLSGADLFEAGLWNANLSKANLGGANLMGTYLGGSHLAEANLTEANLFLAHLDGANLRGANLSGAVFEKVHLEDANLSQAKLDNTSLAEAYLKKTIFAFTSLRTAKGLDTCNHFGPSSLDYHTLMASGRLPEVFLRGCGLADSFIDYLPSFWKQPIEFYSCFISYSHEDKAFARLLHDRLQGQGIRCWLDEHQLLPGDDMHDRIDQGIRLWDKVLLCASKSSLTSWWVDGEINRAFQKEAQIMKERGKKVLALIPLSLDGFLFSDHYQSGKKAELTSRVAANFVGWEKDHALFDRELKKVIRTLRTDDGGREKPPRTKL